MVDTQVLEIAHKCGYFANNFQGSKNTDQEKNREAADIINPPPGLVYIRTSDSGQVLLYFMINILSMIVTFRIISILI